MLDTKPLVLTVPIRSMDKGPNEWYSGGLQISLHIDLPDFKDYSEV